MVEQLMGLMNVGEDWILYLLLVTSVVCVGITIERIVVVMRTRAGIAELKSRLLGYMADGNIDGAKKYFAAQDNSPSKIVSAALGALDRSPEAMQEAIEGEVIEQRMRLERGLDFLGTVGSNAPFVGLLGTVLGIIEAFHQLAKAKTAEPQVVMSGISMSLVATATGLAVAIPALIAFNYFKAFVRDLMRSAEILCKPILSHSLDLTLGGHAEPEKKGKAAKEAEV